MADSITVQIVREFEYDDGDVAQIRVGGVLQADRHPIWAVAGPAVLGEVADDASPFGFAPGLPFGVGLLGEGWFGQGADVLDLQTLGRWVAGDYTVAVRVVDQAGNAGDWSGDTTIEHRPTPPAPSNVTVAGGLITFDWGDVNAPRPA